MWYRTLRIAAVAASIGLLGLSGCATISSIRPPLEATLADERALATVELAYQAAATAALAAVDAGLVEPGSDEAVRIADTLATAHRLIVQARAAQAAGQHQTVAELVAQALVLIGEARRET